MSPKAARGLEQAIREDIAMQSPEEADAKVGGAAGGQTDTVRAVEIMAQVPPQRKRWNPLPEDLEDAIRDLRQALKGTRAGVVELESVYVRASLSLVESDNLYARQKGATALLKLMESRKKQRQWAAAAERERAHAERLRRGVNRENERHVNALLEGERRPRIGIPRQAPREFPGE